MKKMFFFIAGVLLLSIVSCNSGNNKEREKRIKDSMVAIQKLNKESDSLDKIFKEHRAKDSLANMEKNKSANSPVQPNAKSKENNGNVPIHVNQDGGIHLGQPGN